MTSVQFCYWLQGYFELTGVTTGFTAEQAITIKEHLAMVFVHEIDPSHGDSLEQAKLSAVHEGVTLEQLKEEVEKTLKAMAMPRPERPLSDVTLRC